MNNFEQVSSDSQDMSLAGLGSEGSHVPCMGPGYPSGAIVKWGPPMDRLTHMTENITFPQLRWRMVNIRLRHALSSDN